MFKLENLIYKFHEDKINSDNISKELLPVYNYLYQNGYSVKHRIDELSLDFKFFFHEKTEDYELAKKLTNDPVFPKIELTPRNNKLRPLFELAEAIYDNINNGRKYKARKHRSLLAEVVSITF